MARHVQKQARDQRVMQGHRMPFPQRATQVTSIWERSQLLIDAPHFATFMPTPGFLNNFFMITLQEEKIKLNLNSPQ